MSDRMRRLCAMLLLAGGCAGWNGTAQRLRIERRGQIIKEYRHDDVITFVWRQDRWHYNKWVCNVGRRHDCFLSYSVDQIARSCGIGHDGPEKNLECAGLRRDEDLARYIRW